MLVHTSHKIDFHEEIYHAIYNYLMEIQSDQDLFIKEAKKLYNSEDGMMNNYLSEQLEKQNIKLLAVYQQYFGSVFLGV